MNDGNDGTGDSAEATAYLHEKRDAFHQIFDSLESTLAGLETLLTSQGPAHVLGKDAVLPVQSYDDSIKLVVHRLLLVEESLQKLIAVHLNRPPS